MFLRNVAFNSGRHDPAWRRFVGRWALVSGLLVAVVCHFSYDFFQFDEYYQVTEFVSFKLGKTPERALAWEYHSEIRPWLQPAVYYAIARGLNLVGIENPFTLAEAFRFASGACAWAAIVSLMLSARVLFDDEVRRRGSVIILATLFILPYLAARTSSEAVSGSLFSLGFAALMLGSGWRRGAPASGGEEAKRTPHPRPLYRNGRGESGVAVSSGDTKFPRIVVPKVAALVAGIFFGLAFDCRYQIAFAVLGLLAWLYLFSAENHRATIFKLAVLSCGVFLAVALGMAADCWGYGHMVVAPWNYFRDNVLLGIAERYGKSPVWWYLIGANSGPMLPLTLLWTIALLAAWLRYPKHVITWTTLAFCLAHSAVSHKEVRFLFPIAQLAALAIMLGLAPGANGWERPAGLFARLRTPRLVAWLWQRRASRRAKALYALNFVSLAAMGLATHQPSLSLQKMIYDRFPGNCYAYILGRDTKSLYSNVGVDMYFYRSPGFHLARLDGYDELDALMHGGPAKFLLITDRVQKAPEQDLVAPGAKLVYRNYPEWVENYNYFNWLERSRRYSVYEVETTAADGLRRAKPQASLHAARCGAALAVSRAQRPIQ